jgi:ribosomal protein S18 acetylase RimI-like enzyme
MRISLGWVNSMSRSSEQIMPAGSRLSTANHPDHEDHFYLPFIAVRPQFFGRGIGTALMCDRLAALDGQGLPTYLEASNRDSARLYERLGYKRLDRTTDMPGGPSLYPMWRNAA